jgi:triacylglycerol lipase
MLKPSLLAVLALLVAAVPARAADPPLRTATSQLAAALSCPSGLASAPHEAVLLVHGTGLNAEESWAWNYSKTLPPLGRPPCAVTLPEKALGDIQVATEYVVYAIRRVAALSGRRVDVITHSQGGMEGRWALRWWRSARDRVDDLVLLASPNHGITAADLCAASGNCWPAVWQMRTGSNFLTALNAGDETPGAVSYTNVYSLTDELVEPSTTVPLTGASNVAVQSLCPGRVVHHGGLLDDAVAGALVLDALGHPGGADPARISPATCAEAFMPGVTAEDAISGNATLYSHAAQAFSEHPGVTSEPAPAAYVR